MSAKYKSIAKDIQNQIVSLQSMKPYKLPTEQELCKKYQVSRQTVRAALHLLEQENYIKKRQGSGCYTVPSKEFIASKKIILLLSEENEYIYPGFISDIKSVLRTRELSLTTYTTGHDVNKERELLQQFLTDSIAVLVAEPANSYANPNMDLYEKLQLSGTHIVFLDYTPSAFSKANTIMLENEKGGELVGEHLISQGCLHVACILPDFAANAQKRYKGLQHAYRQKDLPIPSENIYWFSIGDLRQLRQKKDTGFLSAFIRIFLLKKKDSLTRYDAILCYNDEIAYHLMKELSYCGIQVPEQISVISFDNSYLCPVSNPTITSVGLPFHEPGNSIGTAILNLIFDESTENKTLPWKLYIRGSVVFTANDF